MENLLLHLLMGMVLWILLCHYLADFVSQSRWMGMNKSHSMEALSSHTAAYGLVLFAGSYPVSLYLHDLWILWVVGNTIAHGATDFLTSRLSSWCWKNKHEYAFWNVIGGDQLIHQTILIGSFAYLLTT